MPTETAPLICDCGHPESPHSDCTRGYGTDADGRTHCYDCCAARDRESLRTSDRFSGYISADGKRLTGWPGFSLGRVESWGTVHPWTRRSCFGERRYVRIVDCHGNRWHGTAAPGMYANLRRSRSAS